ncbi:MAG: EFR1 family ferrodoxin [Firmicutes bacterium]|nr:EFR1 family ferrodoxin [Bacillota bacterium]
MILYFTGTGNSRYVAEKIAEATGEQLLDMGERIKAGNHEAIQTQGRVIISVPTYSWRIPKVVENWLRKTPIHGVNQAWFLMTCGSDIGNANKYVERLCKAKGWKNMGTAQIVMPENYIAMFDAPDDEKAKLIIRKADSTISARIKDIQNMQSFKQNKIKLPDKLKSGPVNHVFYGMCVKDKQFRTLDSCIGCGKCAELCMLNNIGIVDGKPEWKGNCTHCMACIAHCPVEAIEYGQKSVGQPRYYI